MSFPTKLTLGSTFSIYPPRSGGQMRIFHLYRHVARTCPVDVIALVDSEEHPHERELAPGFTEIRVVRSAAHSAGEARLAEKAGVPVTDIAFSQLHELTPEFAIAVKRSIDRGGALVASHPYTLPALVAASDQLPVWYDAHNVEGDLKASILARDRTGRRLLSATRAIERECCERAERVFATSDEDAQRLRGLYRVPAGQLAVVPNGVDTAAIEFASPAQRRRLQERLRMRAPLVLFIGSWHEPNLRAAWSIVNLATSLPELEFGFVGSICKPLEEDPLPANVNLFGVVPDEHKQVLLKVAAVALNPMSEGSGTNMKMLDYLASGVPTVSTTVGARGLALEPQTHVQVARIQDFAPAITATLGQPVAEAEQRAQAARRHVEEHFDWLVAARRLTLAGQGPGSADGDRVLSSGAAVS